MPCKLHSHAFGCHGSHGLLGEPMPFAEPGVEPHYPPSRRVRIEHYDLDLRIWPEERRFEGTARIDVRPLGSFRGQASFDLAGVRVLAVTDGEGRALEHTHDDDVLRIRVDAPSRLEIRWEGRDPAAGLYFTGPRPFAPDRQHMAWTQCQDEDGHFVFPCHDHPGIKHPWSIRVEGPAGTTLLSNGALVQEGEDGGRAWARYKVDAPMPAYLFTAVCAKLVAVEASWRDRPVRYLVPEGEDEAIVRAMGKTPLMIEAFSERVGVDYPWPRYDQVVVHDFIFGGMENVACTTMTDLLLVDERGILEWDPDSLVAHELAHQWFGDLVTCSDWSQGWLNESWATFMEAYWWEVDRDAADASFFRFGAMGEYLEEFSGRYTRPIVSYDFREPIDVFDRHLYQKGSCVLWTLRTVLGDEPFWAGVKLYLERHAGGNVHSRDFQVALQDATGENLERFFHQWVHAPGHPELEIKLGSDDGLLTVGVKQTQSGEGAPQAYHLPLRLEIHTSTGVRAITLPVRERERAWALPIDGDVQCVRIDPGLGVLATHTWKGPRAWLERTLLDADPVIAIRSARALLDDGSAPAVRAVRKALGTHGHWGVRCTIAGLLGKTGAPEDRDVLLAALGSDGDPRVRRAAADTVGRFREAAVADALIEVAKAEPITWQLTGAALKALGTTRDPRAVGAITSRMGTPSWGETVRLRALAGLASTQDPAVLDVLIANTDVDLDDRVRYAAATALGSLADVVPDTRDAVRERLVEMLGEAGFRAQLGAIAALAALGDPKANGALARVHRSAPDGRTRRAAYEALVRIKRGRTTEQGLAGLRRDLEKLHEENAGLRSRLDALERDRDAEV